MTPLLSLWLPILLSAVFIFIASSVIHMFMPWHKSDYAGVPDEARVRAAVGPLNIPPGDYLVPKPGDMKEMGTPEYKAKHNEGPVLLMTVMPNGMRPMGPIFINWFIYLIIIAIAAACMTGALLAPGADHRRVFHFTGAITFIAYGMALPQASIWYYKKWSTTFKGLFDSLIYGVITGLTFAWMWPQ
ncbi:MAG: hypothetical protein V4558_15535 [Gemmatimonadota bacterium]